MSNLYKKVKAGDFKPLAQPVAKNLDEYVLGVVALVKKLLGCGS